MIEPIAPPLLREEHSIGSVEEARRYYNYNTSSSACYWDEECPDDNIDVLCYRWESWREALFYLAAIASAGITLLVCYWFADLRVRLTARRCTAKEADCALVRNLNSTEIAAVEMEFVETPRSKEPLRVFSYRFQRYVLDPTSGHFYRLHFAVPSTAPLIRQLASAADLTEEHKRNARRALYGPNTILVPFRAMGILVEQVLHPFYVFQILSIVLWALWDYWSYLSVIVLLSVGCLAIEFYELHEGSARLQKMADFKSLVPCRRVDGNEVLTPTEELVPGDVIRLQDHSTVPCDLLLLGGSYLMDESLVSGESSPVLKLALPDHDQELPAKTARQRHVLWAGTRVLQVRGEHTALLVLRTGYGTARGRLIASMQMPQPVAYSFYKDSFKFLGVLSVLAILGIAFTLYIDLNIYGVDLFEAFLRAGDLITIVVPPALPIVLTIGAYFSLRRLRSNQIYCSCPNRINLAGKASLVCFDKTGTLTHKSMDVAAFKEVGAEDGNDVAFQDEHLNADAVSYVLRQAMACCHSVRIVKERLAGDPLDVKLFRATKWSIEDKEDGVSVVHPPARMEASHTPVEILRRFEFTSALQRMTVIGRITVSQETFLVTKGAAEAVVPLCAPKSVPSDWQAVLRSLSLQGYHVIAYAYHVTNVRVAAQDLTRKQAENPVGGLTFLSFVMLRNQLKPDAQSTVAQLTAAAYPCLMLTGDNPYTAVSIARECGILSPNTPVYLAEIGGRVTWHDVSDPNRALDDSAIVDAAELTNSRRGGEEDAEGGSGFELALTGAAFELLSHNPRLLQAVIGRARVYARMLPEQKVKAIELLQERGETVVMCGDGPNDLGALRQADVGLSVSQAEASIASPFTSVHSTLASLVTLMREGRCALVTSFQTFKYMAAYSLIEFATEIILYSINSMLGDYQFIWIDVIVIAPLAFFISLTGPDKTLPRVRPTSTLVAPAVVLSLLGQVLINVIFQVTAYYFLYQQRHEGWYTPLVPQANSDNSYCAETTTLFLISSFQYISVGLAFNEASPFREPTYKNGWFTASTIGLYLAALYLTLMPDSISAHWLELYPLSMDFRILLLILACLNFLATFVFEQLIVVHCLGKLGYGKRIASWSPYRRFMGEKDYHEYSNYSV